ncbi:hypothetical protein VNO77_34404 [Canavalia gladiata]|uniref:Uncharacterized protein n=1 Tax=Canavalia gladiata TaxID=3824 RepID=A0AAN9KFI0_CANGL
MPPLPYPNSFPFLQILPHIPFSKHWIMSEGEEGLRQVVISKDRDLNNLICHWYEILEVDSYRKTLQFNSLLEIFSFQNGLRKFFASVSKICIRLSKAVEKQYPMLNLKMRQTDPVWAFFVTSQSDTPSNSHNGTHEGVNFRKEKIWAKLIPCWLPNKYTMLGTTPVWKTSVNTPSVMFLFYKSNRLSIIHNLESLASLIKLKRHSTRAQDSRPGRGDSSISFYRGYG